MQTKLPIRVSRLFKAARNPPTAQGIDDSNHRAESAHALDLPGSRRRSLGLAASLAGLGAGRLLLGGLTVGGLAGISTSSASSCGLLDFRLRRLNEDGVEHLCDYLGRVVMVVNTASKCGFTGQFEDLEALHDQLSARGLAVLGFPSNDFANQDPGTEAEIADFCRSTYSVRFPMFEKVHVRGPNAHPLYQALAAASGDVPQWNFHKYLLDREGRLVGSWGAMSNPARGQIRKRIEELLGPA